MATRARRSDAVYRVTPQRAAELEARIAAVEAAAGARLDDLERRLARAEQRSVLGFELARGRIAAELTVLKDAEGV